MPIADRAPPAAGVASGEVMTMPRSVRSEFPDQPRAGDRALVCLHHPDLHDGHYFFVPDGSTAGGWFFLRPDGSTGGPMRWMVMCTDCFTRYAHNAFECPCGSDITWPAGLEVSITRAFG